MEMNNLLNRVHSNGYTDAHQTQEKIDEHSEKFNKMHKEPMRLKSTKTKMKHTLERINTMLDDAKEQSVTWKTGQWKLPDQKKII